MSVWTTLTMYYFWELLDFVFDWQNFPNFGLVGTPVKDVLNAQAVITRNGEVPYLIDLEAALLARHQVPQVPDGHGLETVEVGVVLRLQEPVDFPLARKLCAKRGGIDFCLSILLVDDGHPGRVVHLN